MAPTKIEDICDRREPYEMTSYALWSQAFIDISDDATCMVEEREWTRLQDENIDAKRIFGRIGYEGDWIHFALGSPVRANDFEPSEHPLMFVPHWIQEHLGLNGSGDVVEVEWMQQEAFPEATKIVLRPHDSAFHDANAKEELERALTRYGVLQAGSTIPIPIESMGNYVIMFDVVETQPAELVLLEGDEVEIEFARALNSPEPTVPPVTRPPTPRPFEEMISEEPVDFAPGIPLGGISRPRLADGRAWNPWRETA